MPDADLPLLVHAFLNLNYEISTHYLEDRAVDPSRPLPSEIEDGLARDEPRIQQDDHGQGDSRGATCRVDCETPAGKRIRVVVNYERNPVKVVTAYEREERGEANAPN